MLETIHLNLLNKDEGSDLGPQGWGKPTWELPVNAAGDKEAIANATGSYLGRLVPLSRSIRLAAEGRQMILANGLEYPLAPVFREAAATMIQREDKLGVLSAALGRSIWRQLFSIAVKRSAKTDPISGPLALRNIEEQPCSLWTGALIAAGNGKIEDVVEAAYDIPSGMFRDAGRKLYEEGVGLADSWQEAARRAVVAYGKALKIDSPQTDRMRHHFWTVVEQHVPTLLKLTDKPEEAGDLKVSAWGQRVKEAAHTSFDFACSRQNPRQIQAYAIGLQQLFLPKPKDPNAPVKKKASTKK